MPSTQHLLCGTSAHMTLDIQLHPMHYLPTTFSQEKLGENQLYTHLAHWPKYVFHCFSTEAGEEITASSSALSHSQFRLLIQPFSLNPLEPLR